MNLPPMTILRWPTRDMLQVKRSAANKKDALQTKNERCKQKTNAANKKDALQTKKRTLQTKNERCK